jgi:hypothetical protein
MCNTIVGAGAGAASRYGSGSDQKMRLIAAPAPQHWFWPIVEVMPGSAMIFETQWTINPSYNQRQRFFHFNPEPQML